MFLRVIRRVRGVVLGALVLCASVLSSVSYASPFGQGVFGTDVPFGSGTSMTVALGGNPSLNMSLVGAISRGVGFAYTDRDDD